jgi:hypothetical protein
LTIALPNLNRPSAFLVTNVKLEHIFYVPLGCYKVVKAKTTKKPKNQITNNKTKNQTNKKKQTKKQYIYITKKTKTK